MGECLCCGSCCRAVALPYTERQLEQQLASGVLQGADEVSARFILQNWRQISRREAAAAVPGLVVERGYRYYRCTWLAGNLCRDHANRPPICRGFPYYDEPESTNVDDALAWEGCGYHSHQS